LTVGSLDKRGKEPNEQGLLRGLSVLLVEDDFLLLSELESVLHDAGAETVYSCRTVGEANALLDKHNVSAAILDVRIGRESAAPVARKLARHATPFLFYTGQLSTDRFMSEWPNRPVLSKPARSQVIVRALADLLRHEVELPLGGVPH
jgi:DNA-binding NtrC family response regulator